MYVEEGGSSVCGVKDLLFNDTATAEIYTRWSVGSSDVYKKQIGRGVTMALNGLCGQP